MSNSENPSPPLSSAVGVTAADIASKMIDGNNPLDFIQQNLAKSRHAMTAPTPEQQPVRPPQPVAPPLDFSQPVSDPSLDFPLDAGNPPIPPAGDQPPAETPPVGDEPQSDADKLLDEIKPKRGKEESLKHLRTKTTELERTLQEREAALAEKEAELNRFKTGEAIPEVLQKKEERIAELETYERLHALKLSPEYRQKYIEPLDSLKNKAIAIAKEYQVDESVLHQAMNITNKKDLNTFLRNHFDEVAAFEVRSVLDKMREVHQESVLAEKEPAESFERLKAEARANEERERASYVNRITSSVKEGWVSALSELRSSGEYPELMFTGDPNHDKISKPLVEDASREMGKLMTIFGTLGLKDLPLEVSKIIAKTFLLSRITPVVSQERSIHYQRAEEIRRNSERRSSMVRPAVGQSGSGEPVSTPAHRPSLSQQSEELLRNVQQSNPRLRGG